MTCLRELRAVHEPSGHPNKPSMPVKGIRIMATVSRLAGCTCLHPAVHQGTVSLFIIRSSRSLPQKALWCASLLLHLAAGHHHATCCALPCPMTCLTPCYYVPATASLHKIAARCQVLPCQRRHSQRSTSAQPHRAQPTNRWCFPPLGPCSVPMEKRRCHAPRRWTHSPALLCT